MSLKNEQRTVSAMIRLFCRQRHGERSLCASCSELLQYAEKCLSKCQFGDNKPQCKNCPVHCYFPKMRKRISEVMKHSGPRMLFVHPVMGLRHLFNRGKPNKSAEGDA
ncbi:nitrous oxide-stimulated promoter family protein [Thermodesulfobacteriota bacterium]